MSGFQMLSSRTLSKVSAETNIAQVSDFKFNDEGLYTGEIHAGTLVPHGSGRMTYHPQTTSDSGDVESYEGQWYWGSWQGSNGVLQFRNGDTYMGSFEQNTRQGQGLYMWADGRTYEGEFYQNQRHGKGSFTFADGAIYEGDFVMGKRHGHGKYSFPNGSSYEGEWKDGQYDGYGVFTWNDGRTYSGEWKASQHHGRGRKTDCYGQVEYDGLWANHKPEGDLRKPAPATNFPPQEVIISANYTSQDDCSDLDGNLVDPPRLRRTVTPPSPRAPTQTRMSRARTWAQDPNGDSRTEYSRPQELYHGPSRTQEIFRFGSQAVSTTNSKPAPKPEGYWAEPTHAPLQQRVMQVSRGELPLRANYESLPEISTLIRDQQRALEKYNAFHRSRELPTEEQMESNEYSR